MGENKWHKKVREEIYSNYNPPEAYQSHSDNSKLYLFRTDCLEKSSRINCLSDADIIVLSPDSKRVAKIIETETSLNPKKFMGIVLTTHLCTQCSYRPKEGSIGKKYMPLKNIELEIVYRKAPTRSKKDLKVRVFENALKEIIRSTEGCISKPPDIRVIFVAHS